MNASPTGTSERRRWIISVGLIFHREMRDQFRDRRTMLVILVLPVLLYPLLGSLLMQLSQFSRQSETRVAVIGHEHLEQLPPLVEQRESKTTRFHADLGSSAGWSLSSYCWREFGESGQTSNIAESWVSQGVYDAVLLIPPEVGQVVDAPTGQGDDRPTMAVVCNQRLDRSAGARERLGSVLQRWKTQWVQQHLDRLGVGHQLLEPFTTSIRDVGQAVPRSGAIWTRLLPLVLLIWAMTGAFYPAIDLVAGEKERGTLETLLCSPAARGAIVWGKLACVTCFSLLTALLNSASMLLTGALTLGNTALAGTSLPPLTNLLWMLVALLPLSVLFSTLALGISAAARSSKEGQYYLVPMMLVILPLAMLTTLPGISLGLGTSLVPVTGLFLSIQAVIDGRIAMALLHLPIVACVTMIALVLAFRWTRGQFESESVLFHGGQSWNPRKWFFSMLAQRPERATPAQACAAGLLILVALFFAQSLLGAVPTDLVGLIRATAVPQLGMILLPTLAIAWFCTRPVSSGLRLTWPGIRVLLASALLGLALHPTYLLVAGGVSTIYPISESAQAALAPLSLQIAESPWWAILLVMALLPAVCEELAFRGFILGGLLTGRQPGRAILVTAILFGISHGVLQQSISATLMGIVLGWVSWRTGSVLPAMMMHALNNALSVSIGRLSPDDHVLLPWVLAEGDRAMVYQPLWTLVCLSLAITILLYLSAQQPWRMEESWSPPAAPAQSDLQKL